MSDTKHTGPRASRRHFLNTSLATGLGFAAAAQSPLALAKTATPKFDAIYDIIVVGSGVSGSMAALVAAQAGAKVLLVEKLNRLGGTSRFSGLDFACVGSEAQKAEGINDTPEAMVADMSKVAANLNDLERALNIARHTAEAQNILLEAGVKWKALLKLGGHSQKRCLIAEGGGAGILKSIWANYPKFPNLTVMSATKLDELLTNDKGDIIGIAARKDYLFDAALKSDDRDNTSGTPVRFGARQAVIMATGGYARDKEFMRYEVPFLEHTANSASVGATAGALKSMMRVGARPVQLSLYRFSFALPTEDLIYGVAIDPSTGKRYASEALGRNPISAASLAVLAKSKGKMPFILWDEKGLAKFHNMTRVAKSLAGLNGRNSTLVKFDTLDALAEHYGTLPAVLKETIARYNAMVTAGKDEEFGKPLTRDDRALEPISETGPYYGALMSPRWDYCPGGITTDTHARALSLTDTKPMVGLYVVGEAAGGIHGAERLTACSMPDCVVTGMLAAQHATALTKRTL